MKDVYSIFIFILFLKLLLNQLFNYFYDKRVKGEPKQ